MQNNITPTSGVSSVNDTGATKAKLSAFETFRANSLKLFGTTESKNEPTLPNSEISSEQPVSQEIKSPTDNVSAISSEANNQSTELNNTETSEIKDEISPEEKKAAWGVEIYSDTNLEVKDNGFKRLRVAEVVVNNTKKSFLECGIVRSDSIEKNVNEKENTELGMDEEQDINTDISNDLKSDEIDQASEYEKNDEMNNSSMNSTYDDSVGYEYNGNSVDYSDSFNQGEVDAAKAELDSNKNSLETQLAILKRLREVVNTKARECQEKLNGMREENKRIVSDLDNVLDEINKLTDISKRQDDFLNGNSSVIPSIDDLHGANTLEEDEEKSFK